MKALGWISAALLAVAGCGGEEVVPVVQVPCGGCAGNELCDETRGVCLGSVGWSADLPVNVQGEVAVRPDGVVLASGALQRDRFYQPTLYAFSPEGESLWERPIGTWGPWGFPSRPVLGNDRRIYLTINYSLFVVDPDGDVDWSLDTPVIDGRLGVNAANPPPAPSIGMDGVIYWQFLAATGVNGDLRWRQYVDPYSLCETALPIRNDRVLFREAHSLVALNNKGDLAWHAEQPLGYFGEAGCGMIPFSDQLVVSTWCEESPSAFACGYLMFMDVQTGEPQWVTAPPKKVAMATTILMRPDRSLALFSVGAPGNEEDPAHMWIVSPDGRSTGPTIEFPWHGIYHVALGDDGIFYATTSKGLAAITENGEILWRYEPDYAEGSYSGPPAIGSNGCIYYESVKQMGGRGSYGREVICLESTATGLADSPWPRSIGGNHSGMRSP